jgi:DNA-binding NtrC family response regulator
MSKHSLAPEKGNVIWESLWDKYLPRYGSKKSRKGTDSADHLIGKKSHDEIIDQFIDQFCIKQIKHKVPLKDLLTKIENVILVKVLSRFDGCQKDASRFLKIKSTTLHEKMKKHKIRIVKTPQLFINISFKD